MLGEVCSNCYKRALKGLEMKSLATQSSKRKENNAKLYFEISTTEMYLVPKSSATEMYLVPKCSWYRNVPSTEMFWYRKVPGTEMFWYRNVPGTEKSWYRNVLLPKKAVTEMFRYRKVRTEMWNYRNVPYRNVKQPIIYILCNPLNIYKKSLGSLHTTQLP